MARTRARGSLDSAPQNSLNTRVQTSSRQAGNTILQDRPGGIDYEEDGTRSRKRRRMGKETFPQDDPTPKRQPRRPGRVAASPGAACSADSHQPSQLPYACPTYTGSSGSCTADLGAAQHAISAAKEFLKIQSSKKGPVSDATLPVESQTPGGMTTLLSRIISYNETTVESPQGGKGKARLKDNRQKSGEEAGELRLLSFPILDYLSFKILGTLIGSTFEETIANTTRPDTKVWHQYPALKSLFELVKRLFTTKGFISDSEVAASREVKTSLIRRANLTIFMLSLFGGQDVGWYNLNQEFMSLFIPGHRPPTKIQTQLLIELKIQAYIAAVAQGDLQLDEVHEALFPPDFKQRLLSRHPRSRKFSIEEIDLVFKANELSAEIRADPQSKREELAPEKHPLNNFLREVHQYTKDHCEELIGVPLSVPHQPSNLDADVSNKVDKEKGSASYGETNMVDVINEPSNAEVDVVVQGSGGHEQDLGVTSFSFDPDLASLQAQAAYQQPTSSMPTAMSVNLPNGPAQAQQSNQSPYFFNQGQSSSFDPSSEYPNLPHMQQAFPNTPNVSASNERYEGQENPPSYATQSAPTQILYERARQAATAKASASSKRASNPSQRRPWTQEEENALMAGLDRVKGPHWSQILGMFGPGGSINEVLKDRNQVQLKDKARNLKLFFLKSGHEVPYYLQFVTGELKTRAPAQAAKNEARQKEKMSEERAYIQGVMALAGTASAQGGDQGAKSGEDAEGSSQDAEGSPEGNAEISTSASAPQQLANIAPMLPMASFSAEFQAQLAAAAAAATGEAPQ